MSNSDLQLIAAPPLLIGAALLVWGWQCELLPFAVVMALLVESSRILPWRWAITDKEFNTLSDFSGVVFFVAVVYIFSSEGARGIFVILEILPFILYPLLVTQKYSDAGQLSLSALFVSLRKLDPALSPEAGTKINLGLPYFILCLVSASAGNQRTIIFFVVTAALIAVVLWFVRPRRYSPGLWLTALVLAVSLAYATQIGMRQLQASIEASFLGIFDQFMWRYRDPDRLTTAIGSLGRLKLSDRIVLRLKTDRKLVSPVLLREASYSKFGHGVWSSQDSEFTVIDQNTDGSWTLAEQENAEQEATISTYMIREKGVVPVPHGSVRIKDVAAVEIARNPHGTVSMDIREGWIQYGVEYGNKIANELPPDEKDLFLLDYYRDDFEKLAEELKLSSMLPEQAVATVHRFFQDNFTYSLDQKHRYPKGRYLAKFLYENRSGHCEYFATATALLLRSAGIPTRYAVGYSVDEYSTLEGQYIARARDAHSWTLVYFQNQWQVVDSTPAVWAPYEDENASIFEPLMDIWSWVSYSWSRWQSDDLTEEEESNGYLVWLLVPLVAFLAWRIYFRERVQLRRGQGSNRTQAPEYPGSDSSFFELVEVIESKCLRREQGETLTRWLGKLDKNLPLQQIYSAKRLHYRYRFDPCGVSELEHEQLKDLVKELLGSQQNWLPGNRPG